MATMDPDTVSGASKRPKIKDPDAPQESPTDEEQQDTTGKPLDANRYATKKTIAQGMLDIALLTANASQLKYILQVGPRHEFYSLMLGLISTSMILQVLTGIVMVVLSTSYNINKTKHHIVATVLNDVVLSMIILVTTVNVVIGVFDMRDPSAGLPSTSTEQPATAEALHAASGFNTLALRALRALRDDPGDLYDLQTS